MASEGLHESGKALSKETRDRHRALVSLQEELEAIDWYCQRADACRDPQLKAILLHNMREEMEHSAMLIEWLRREYGDFDRQLREHLFNDASVIAEDEDNDEPAGQTTAYDSGTSTIGSLKE
jgi:ferritin-like protein